MLALFGPGLTLVCPLTRNIDLDNPEEFEAFKWFWEIGIGRIVGAKGWGEGHRHYTTMSRAQFHYDHSKPLFNASQEAFFVLLYENHYKRWKAQIAWFALRQNWGKSVPARCKETKHLQINYSRYTTQDGGQSKGGAWTDAGIERYNVLYADYEAAKFSNYYEKHQGENANPPVIIEGIVKQEWHDLEEAFLVRLRAQLGIQGNDANADGNRRRGANAAAPQAPPVRPAGLFF